MVGGIGTKDISKRYPCVDGIIAETTKQTGHVINLVPGESKVIERNRKGI